MKELLIFINNGNNKINPLATDIWHWVYAHGILEIDYDFDICTFNKPMPTEEGYHIAYTEENEAVIIHLVATEYGKLQGRCCYLDDYESLKYINNPAIWA